MYVYVCVVHVFMCGVQVHAVCVCVCMWRVDSDTVTHIPLAWLVSCQPESLA